MEKDIFFSELKIDEINSFSNMVNNVFEEFVGMDYSEEGNKTFKEYIKSENILVRYNEKTSLFFVAKYNNEIIGILEIKNKDHISLFFVKKEFHGKGIGKKLFENYVETLKQENNEIKIITVNSSFYAEKIYSKMGFQKTNEIQERNGIKYIPMEYNMEINIRKAIESDINSMTLIYNDSIKIFPSNIRNESDYNLFKGIFNTSIVYIAEESNTTKSIGWMAYEINPKYTFIVGLYLLINEQRKGIGTILLKYCIEKIKNENCKLIILKVLKNAPWSIEFYKKNGFIIYEYAFENGKDLDIIKTKEIKDWEYLMYKWL